MGTANKGGGRRAGAARARRDRQPRLRRGHARQVLALEAAAHLPRHRGRTTDGLVVGGGARGGDSPLLVPHRGGASGQGVDRAGRRRGLPKVGQPGGLTRWTVWGERTGFLRAPRRHAAVSLAKVVFFDTPGAISRET